MSGNVICFDLEGPLSPQDNAFEVMGLIPNGHKIFEVLSRYDDLLALEGRADYEPGDTLKLIVPFLIHHRLTSANIAEVSCKALIVPGAAETINALKAHGWKVFIISTSYRQHAENVGTQVGVPIDDIYATKMPLEEFAKRLDGVDLSFIEDIEKEILQNLSPNLENDELVKKTLDKFFWEDLAATPVQEVMDDVRVCGGARKVEGLLDAIKRSGTTIDKTTAVGDSITDFKMLGRVWEDGGLAVAFNANQYSLPYANVSLASPSMEPILAVTQLFREGGIKEVEKVVGQGLIVEGEYQFPPVFSLHPGDDKEKMKQILKAHGKARTYIRGKAAQLG